MVHFGKKITNFFWAIVVVYIVIYFVKAEIYNGLAAKRDLTIDRMIKICNVLDQTKVDKNKKLENYGFSHDSITDPFTGKNFCYWCGDTRRWVLISPGPDHLLQSIPSKNILDFYDCSNGITSTGDIICTNDITTKRYDRGPLPLQLGRNGNWESGVGGYIRKK